MASVGLSEAEAQTLVSHFGERLSVAAINGPSSVVLSGEPDALESALATLAARGIGHRQLPVQYAFHSAQIIPLQPLLLDALAGLRGRPPQIPVYSTVTGERAEDALFEVGYFARNMREPVRFAQAVGAMTEVGCGVFVELSPHPVLGHAIVECLAPRGCEPVVLASLRRGRAERETMLEACAESTRQGVTSVGKTSNPGQGGSSICHHIRGSGDDIGSRSARGKPCTRCASITPCSAAAPRWLELKHPYIRLTALPLRDGYRITALGTGC